MVGRVAHREVIEPDALGIKGQVLAGQAVERAQLRHGKRRFGGGRERATHHRGRGRARHAQLAAHVACRLFELPGREGLRQLQQQALGIHGQVQGRGGIGQVITTHADIVAGTAYAAGLASGQAGIEVVVVGRRVGRIHGNVADDRLLEHQVFDGGIGREGLVFLAQVVDAGCAVQVAGHQRILLLHNPGQLDQLKIGEGDAQR